MSTATTGEAPPGQKRRFVVNVLWSWLGVFINLLVATLLSPFVIRRLGESTFSAWTLALSFIEYFWLIDLGLRAATVKFTAEFRSRQDESQTSELVNTSLLYSSLAGLTLGLMAVVFGHQIAGFLRITEPAFPFLIGIVGVSWAIGMPTSILTAVFEGNQRFDLTTRIWMAGLILRSAGTAVLVASGFGLFQIGLAMLSGQVLMTILAVAIFWRLLPRLSLSPRKASTSMLRRLLGYGKHTMKVMVAQRLLTQSTPFLIAYFLSLPFVAYYTIPVRILDYALDGIGRIGMVTTPNASELMARGQKEAVIQLGIFANRYSVTLFAPIAVFLAVYANELFSVWIRPDFARNSAYLVPVLLISAVIICGQVNSISILFGMARHQRYTTLLLIESILSVVGMAITLPRLGLIGAVCVNVTLAVLNRGMMACILTSRELGISPFSYAAKIYTGPLTAAAVALAVTILLKPYVGGASWPALAAAAAIVGLVYLPLAFFLAVSPEHRQMIASRLTAMWGRILPHAV